MPLDLCSRLFQVALVRVEHDGMVAVVPLLHLEHDGIDGGLKVRLLRVDHEPHLLSVSECAEGVNSCNHIIVESNFLGIKGSLVEGSLVDAVPREPREPLG